MHVATCMHDRIGKALAKSGAFTNEKGIMVRLHPQTSKVVDLGPVLLHSRDNRLPNLRGATVGVGDLAHSHI